MKELGHQGVKKLDQLLHGRVSPIPYPICLDREWEQ